MKKFLTVIALVLIILLSLCSCNYFLDEKDPLSDDNASADYGAASDNESK